MPVIELAERRVAKVVGVEQEIAIGFWIQFLEWRYQARRFRAEKEDAGNQFGVIFGVKTDGKSALKLSNTGDGPVILPSYP